MRRFLAFLAAFSLALPAYAQPGPPPAGIGTVTGTVTTANAVPTATGSNNAIQDNPGLLFSGGNQLQVGNGSNAGTLFLDTTGAGGVFLIAGSDASTFTATLPDNTGTLAELNLAQTWTAKQTLFASVTGGGPFNIPQGTAPSAPVNGDIWTTSAGVFAQIAGGTVGPFGAGGGTGCTVSGTVNQIVSNNGSTGCQSSAATITTGGLFTDPQAGALSASAVTFTGAPITGGSGTSTFPLFYINDGTGPTTFSTAGTELGINAPTGFTGNFLDFHVNGGADVFSVNSAGAVIAAGTSMQLGATGSYTWSGRGALSSPAASTVQFGPTDAATATAETLSFQSATTAGNAGANALFNLSKGATTGAGGDLTFQGTPTGTIGLTAAETISHLGVVKLSPGFIVSTLPASPPTGSRAYVTDQLTACVAAGATLVGGGGVTCPVFYNGGSWVGD